MMQFDRMLLGRQAKELGFEENAGMNLGLLRRTGCMHKQCKSRISYPVTMNTESL